MNALFAHAHTLPEGFEDRSIYIFYLSGGEGAAAKKSGGGEAAAFSVGALRPGLSPAGAPAGDFQPNVVVTREKSAGPLPAFVAEQRKILFERAPKLSVVKEGPYKVAGQAGHQTELAAALDQPRIHLVQWQVVTIRDGFAYCFFCTSTKQRWDADRPRFEAFIAGWK